MNIIQAINASAECRRKVRAFRFPVGVRRYAEAVRLIGVGMYNIFTAPDGAITVTWTPALDADGQPYEPAAVPVGVCLRCGGEGAEPVELVPSPIFRWEKKPVFDVCPACGGTGEANTTAWFANRRVPSVVVATVEDVEAAQAFSEAV